MGRGNVEYKYNDKALAFTSTPIANNAPGTAIWTGQTGAQLGGGPVNPRRWYFAQNIVAIEQGQTATQRIGRKWTIKSLLVNLGLAFDWLQSEKMNLVGRIVLIWDKQCNGTIVKGSDIFDPLFTDGQLNTTDGTIPGFPAICALPNISNSQRFKILHDKTYNWTLGTSTTGLQEGGIAGSMVDKQIKIYKKLNLDIESSTTGAEIGGLRSNNIILGICFNATNNDQNPDEDETPDAGTMVCSLRTYGVTRVRFTDM